MKRVLQEPLLHFLLLGVLIFAAYSRVSKDTNHEPGKILITQGQVAAMAQGFTRTWQRPPSGEELEGLIRDRVQEEVYCREAMALGLDKDDAIVRRRLRQKMEFVSDDIAAVAEPTDDELSVYLKAYPEKFRVPPQFTFRQVYLNPQKRGDNLARDAAQMLAQLNHADGKTEVPVLGDSLMLEDQFAALPASEITKLFGEKFTEKLIGFAPRQWHGPIESGYGMHLVLVSERTEGRLPALAEVRDAVNREWASAQRLEANKKFYAEVLKRYVVTIERPEPVAEQKKLVQAK